MQRRNSRSRGDPTKGSKQPAKLQEGIHSLGQRVLLVVAHPDDETMFFSPTISHYRRLGWSTSLLCLSTGKPGRCYHQGIREGHEAPFISCSPGRHAYAHLLDVS
jgi:hypothetical protein